MFNKLCSIYTEDFSYIYRANNIKCVRGVKSKLLITVFFTDDTYIEVHCPTLENFIDVVQDIKTSMIHAEE